MQVSLCRGPLDVCSTVCAIWDGHGALPPPHPPLFFVWMKRTVTRKLTAAQATSSHICDVPRDTQQTGESFRPECGHRAPRWLSSVESSPAWGVHTPSDPLPCPTPGTERTDPWSVFQQVSVQIHEGLINVTCYGTQRSPVWAQQHWHRLLPVAEGDTGALRGEPERIFFNY